MTQGEKTLIGLTSYVRTRDMIGTGKNIEQRDSWISL